jgi:hypothetical protein
MVSGNPAGVGYAFLTRRQLANQGLLQYGATNALKGTAVPAMRGAWIDRQQIAPD